MIYILNFNNEYNYPEDRSKLINTTSRSNNWSRGLSPFFVGPIDLYDGYESINMENLWQYSKVYPEYDDNGKPSDSYFLWARKGWNNHIANRYPMGRNKPLYSWWNGKALSYIEARKEIYIPLYAQAVKETPAFDKLKELYESEEHLYLQDFDAHNLTPGKFTYDELINNPHIKLGHAYVLAMMLEKNI